MIAVIGVAAAVLWSVSARDIITAAYEGRSIGAVNRWVANHRSFMPERRTLDYYIELGSRVPFIIAVLTAAAIGLWVLLVHRRRAAVGLVAVFNKPESALNLAVFRVVLCVTGLCVLEWHAHTIRFVAALPAELRTPVPIAGVLMDLLPPGRWIELAIWLLRGVLVMGILGLAARPALAAGAVLFTYVFGVHYSVGVFRHIHHCVPILMAVTACSRCADVLAVDAAVRAVRRADKGVVDVPADSPRYGLPLRLVWLCMGLMYFFPGFWKFVVSPVEYASGENLRHLLWNSWLDAPPPFRIDQVSIALIMGGTLVVLWETLWVVWVFMDRWRWALAVFGVSFHFGTRAFMHIPFYALTACYAALIDWARLWRWAGRRVFGEPLVVLFDGNCKLCRRTAGVLGTLDVLGQLRFVNMLDVAARRAAGVDRFDEAELAMDMHVVAGPRSWKGFDGYRVLSGRMPMLWPMLPFLYLGPVAAMGRKVYRRVADSRLCTRLGAPDPAAQQRVRAELHSQAPGWTTPSGKLALAVTAVIAAAFVFTGVIRNTGVWPVSCFPTFAGPVVPSTERAELIVVGGDGERLWRPVRVIDGYSPYVFDALGEWLGRGLQAGGGRRELALKVLRHWLSIDPLPSVGVATALRLDWTVLTTVPEELSRNPLSRRTIVTLTPTGEVVGKVADAPAGSAGEQPVR